MEIKNLRKVEGLDRRIDFNSDKVKQISVETLVKGMKDTEYVPWTNQRIQDLDKMKTIVRYSYQKNKTTRLIIEEVIIGDGAYCFDYSYVESLKVIKE